MDVAVRELKAKLSAYLRRAAAGEVITVTDRGRAVAVLSPPMGKIDLSAAAAAGWLTPASASGLGTIQRYPARGTVLQALAEDRSE
ncbi:MAG: type II toxin-antitoxin system Phd/YefM family antitoxin [Acidimicrobiales bacterium]